MYQEAADEEYDEAELAAEDAGESDAETVSTSQKGKEGEAR
jgi:hypothetical protein